MSADLVKAMEMALATANRCTTPLNIPVQRPRKERRAPAASPTWQAEAAMEDGEGADEYIARVQAEARGKLLHAMWTQEARELERLERTEDHAWALWEQHQEEISLAQRRARLAAEEAEQKSRIRELLRISIHGKPAVLDAQGLVLEPAIFGERELRARGRIAEANALREQREHIKALIPPHTVELPVSPKFGGNVESSGVNQESSHNSVQGRGPNRISKRPTRVAPRRGHREDFRYKKAGVHPQTREASVNAILHANIQHEHVTGTFVPCVPKPNADSIVIRPAPRAVRRAVVVGLASAWPKGATLIPCAKPMPRVEPVVDARIERLERKIDALQPKTEEVTKAPEIPQWALKRAERALNLAKGLCPCGKSAKLSGVAKVGHVRKCLAEAAPAPEPVNTVLAAKL